MRHKAVLVYIEGEGGGNTTSRRKYNDGEFRKSWRDFLKPLADEAKEQGIFFFQCIPGRGGSSSVNKFAKPLPHQYGALRILLIDSEGPVSDVSRPWHELGRTPPPWADDGHCYLMVQCLETWLAADLEVVQRHFDSPKPCFKRTVYSQWPNLEQVPKAKIQGAIDTATKPCGTGRAYCHADGNMIIGKVDREKLKKELSSARRLFETLAEVIREYATQ